jgi:hypothetical protein
MEYVISANVTAVTRGLSTLNAQEKTHLLAAATTARTWANNADTQCSRALGVLNTPGKDWYDLGPTFTNSFRQKFNVSANNMDALAVPTLIYVRRNFGRISNGLQGPLILVDLRLSFQLQNFFSGWTGGAITRGYERGGRMVRYDSHYQAPGRIHIDFGLLANTNDIARTIVHEGSHKFCGTQDHAYNPNWGNMTDVQAKNNADSYAYFAATPNLAYNT